MREKLCDALLQLGRTDHHSWSELCGRSRALPAEPCSEFIRQALEDQCSLSDHYCDHIRNLAVHGAYINPRCTERVKSSSRRRPCDCRRNWEGVRGDKICWRPPRWPHPRSSGAKRGRRGRSRSSGIFDPRRTCVRVSWCCSCVSCSRSSISRSGCGSRRLWWCLLRRSGSIGTGRSRSCRFSVEKGWC